jgi:hypothetical protein
MQAAATCTHPATNICYQVACNSSLLAHNAPHCLGGGRSGPNGSIRDLRNVFPFIRFVVAITNSTGAVKGGKVPKVLAQSNKRVQ